MQNYKKFVFLPVAHKSRNTWNCWEGGRGNTSITFAQEWIFNKFLLYGNPKVTIKCFYSMQT